MPLARLLALEQALRVPREVEKLQALVHAGPLGGPMASALALQAQSFPALALFFGGFAATLGGAVVAARAARRSPFPCGRLGHARR